MRLLALCLFCLPAMAATLGEPIISFSPMMAADGSKTWRFVAPWKLNSDEIALNNAISGEIGKAHWCDAGWRITSRQKIQGFLMIEGRCL